MLTRYIASRFLVQFIALLLGLGFVLLMLDMLANAGDVVEGANAAGGDAASALIRYMKLRSPVIISTVAPLAVLLGALSSFLGLAKASEVIAMRAAGLSVFRMAAIMMTIGAGLGLGLFWFSETVVVSANAEFDDWQSADFGPKAAVVEGEGSWLTEGNTMIRIGHVMRDASVLYDVRLFKFDDAHELQGTTNIRLAIWEGDHWTAFDVREIGGNAEPVASQVWETHLAPEHFIQASAQPHKMSYFKLREWFGSLKFGNRPAYYYETWLHQKMAGPAVLMIMPLLAALAAFTSQRSGSSVLVMSQGIGIGFLFIVTDNMMLAMGQFGLAPPFLSAWAPLLLFGLLGTWVILEKEN